MRGRAAPWLWGLLVAAVVCAQYPLMYAFRQVWTSRFPHYAAAWPNDGSFTLLSYYGIEDPDQVYYAPKVREASRRLAPRDPFTDREQAGLGLDYLTYLSMGLAFRLLGDMNLTWFLLRLLAALLWFVLGYRVALALAPQRAWAAFCAVTVTGFGYLLSLQFLEALEWRGGPLRTALGAAWTMASYGRTEGVWRLPRPGLTAAALFGVLLVWLRAFSSGRARWWAAAGAAGGLLAYVRLDVWSSMLGASLAFPPAMAAVERRWDRRWALPALIALPLSLPAMGFALAPSEEFLLKLGGKAPWSWDPYTLAYLPVLAWVLRRRRDKPAVLLACVLAAAAVVCNSGRSVYPFLWRIFGNVLLFLLLMAMLPEPWRRKERLWRGAAAALLAAVLAQNVLYAGIRYPWHGLPRHYEEALDWLKRRGGPGCVVAALSPEVNALVPAFTDCKALVANAAPHLSDVPAVENARRALQALALLGGDPDRFIHDALQTRLESDPRVRLDRVQADRAHLKSYLFVRYPLPALEERIAEARRAGPSSFPVDYLWEGPTERVYAAKGFARGLKPVFDNGSVRLYRLPKP